MSLLIHYIWNTNCQGLIISNSVTYLPRGVCTVDQREQNQNQHDTIESNRTQRFHPQAVLHACLGGRSGKGEEEEEYGKEEKGEGEEEEEYGKEEKGDEEEEKVEYGKE